MKLLRETIRKMILQEGMITVDQLPDGVFIRIEEKMNGEYAKIQYVEEDDRQQKLFPTYATAEEPDCWGTIIIMKDVEDIPVWQVTSSKSGDGYGPLLYDIAMEYATQNGLGLMSDRYIVSKGDEGAVNVWDYYMKHRVGNDVEAHQMDDLQNTLTDTYDDNVPQDSAINHAGFYSWMKHSLSKRYTKAPTTLNALGNKVIYV